MNKSNNEKELISCDQDIDYQPLINLFELLLEWDMKDVQEKEEKRKKISEKI